MAVGKMDNYFTFSGDEIFSWKSFGEFFFDFPFLLFFLLFLLLLKIIFLNKTHHTSLIHIINYVKNLNQNGEYF